jgi:acetyl-CoA carboxylase carboxyl transferase subunit beta
MAWFNRSKQNIEDQPVRNVPDGLWWKCSECDRMLYKGELEENLYTCPDCNQHFRIGSAQYLQMMLDADTFQELDADLISTDPLEFVDEKSYAERIPQYMKRTGLNDAIRTGTGRIDDREVVAAVMDFSFAGGSMGSVVGEKFCRAVDAARMLRAPLIAVTASGGARMQEAAISLMQMAKTSVSLALLAEERIPYIVLLTDPTTGGVTASFAMLGDITLAEPKALIGFAGPRVIEQTIKKKLPEGFQRAEFLLEHGFVDHIVHRKELKKTLGRLLSLLPVPAEVAKV